MYITTPLSARNPQIPIEALFDFSGAYNNRSFDPIYDPSATNTVVADKPSFRVWNQWRHESMCLALMRFNDQFADIIDLPDYKHLYKSYKIPKKNGKWRPIDEPCDQLKMAQSALVHIFEMYMPATHHTTAFAYVKRRNNLKALQKHQSNESRWYSHFDFTNFFGNTTKEFVVEMFKQIYPFASIYADGNGAVVEKALSVCFLNGGLPQGSCASPMITNIMMIPIDHELSRSLKDFDHRNFVYTRYADDMTITCKIDFNVKHIEKHIVETLQKFSASFGLNPEKTHYGSAAGRNWNLGLMVNAKNEITVGYMNKKYMKASLTNYVMDRKATNRKWTLEEVQSLSGTLSYYRHVEPEYFDAVVARLSEKFHIDIKAAIKEDLRTM